MSSKRKVKSMDNDNKKDFRKEKILLIKNGTPKQKMNVAKAFIMKKKRGNK